tara:strand:+ start:3306 stop:3554 length:249 start_codon:yes stop_codon:yes gene_type:complete
MGRAIDMEKDIDKLKVQVDRIDAALAKVIDVVDSMQDKGQRTTHVDLVEDVHTDVIEEEVIVTKKDKPKSKSDEKAKRPKKD